MAFVYERSLFMKYTSQKKRNIVLIIDILFILTFVILYFFLPTIMDFAPKCLFAKYNLPCLGCGGTRCVKAFIHLDFIDALNFHPFVFLCIVLAALLLIVINLAWVFKIKKAQKIFEELSNPRYVFIFFGLFIIFAILRFTGILPAP